MRRTAGRVRRGRRPCAAIGRRVDCSVRKAAIYPSMIGYFFPRTSKLAQGRTVPESSQLVWLRNQGEDQWPLKIV
jgi:hypothetical protein